MTYKLLPCPFCGGEAIPCSAGNHFATEKFFVSCGVCGVETPRIARTRKEAIAAWNSRAEPESKPLTLDEMNALNHAPIYILHMDGHGKWSMNGWHIATASSYRNHGRCDLEIDNGNTIIDMQNYGKTWLAYRAKPKEEV